jgi:hypothetical protein
MVVFAIIMSLLRSEPVRMQGLIAIFDIACSDIKNAVFSLAHWLIGMM